MASERYYFICNPAANSGRLEKKWPSIKAIIDSYLDVDDYTAVWTEAPTHATELTKKVLAEGGYTHLISVGGDGVANEMLNALMTTDQDIVMGMIPAGTSNDAHQTHNFPNKTEEAVHMIFDNNVGTFGVGKITGDFGDEPYYFLDHCDTGLAALAARSAKYGTKFFKGEWKYTYYALKNLARFTSNPGTVTIDGEVYEGDFAVVAAGFGQDMSGYHLWPGNTNTSGDFGILLAMDQSRFGMLKLMLAAENGKHIGRDGVVYERGKKIEIDLGIEWPYQAEGEIFTENSKQTVVDHVDNAVKFITGVSD
ncbi:MAG: diacylglycerol/lipid kinase family protein [Candidatus Kariarchaeaceae archaeon]|jgi:diacylglycerol kinase family enzyme